MKNLVSTFILISFVILSCNGQNSKKYQTISPKVFATKMLDNETVQLIDARSPEEFELQHLNNAKNIDWNGENFEEKIKKLDKNTPVFVYCLSGGRSKKSANKLIEMGFVEVYELEGGITNWIANKFPVKK
jgi:rhodanese-related sulfurtransferase